MDIYGGFLWSPCSPDSSVEDEDSGNLHLFFISLSFVTGRDLELSPVNSCRSWPVWDLDTAYIRIKQYSFVISLKVASSPADVAEKADRIITMLPSSMNSIEVYSGANGILK